MAETTDAGSTHRSVLVSLAVNGAETLALGVAAWATGSVALRAQIAANAAEVAVEVFLLIGVLSSARPPDVTHPLGYGRERFFWSLFAALGIFVGGGGLALDEAVQSALHPSPVDHFPIAYLVLAATVVLDVFALEVAVRPLLTQAAGRGISLRTHMQRSTDPAADYRRRQWRLRRGRRRRSRGGVGPVSGDREHHAGHGGKRADRRVAPGRLGALAAHEPSPSFGSRRADLDAARNAPHHRRPAGRHRRPGRVCHRGRAVKLDRRRRCHVR